MTQTIPLNAPARQAAELVELATEHAASRAEAFAHIVKALAPEIADLDPEEFTVTGEAHPLTRSRYARKVRDEVHKIHRATPYVGQPATIHYATDSSAAVVVKVNPKSVLVRAVEPEGPAGCIMLAAGALATLTALDAIIG